MTQEEINEKLEQIVNFRKSSKFNDAIELCFQLLELPEVKEDSTILGKINNSLGIIYTNLTEYEKAIQCYNDSLRYHKETGDQKGYATALGNIGIVYKFLSDFPKALEYFEQSLKIHEDVGNKSGLALNFGNVALLYENISEYAKSLEYHEKALQINKELENKDGIAKNFGNIGIIYKNLGDYERALDYFQISLNINEEIGNKLSKAIQLGNIGIVYDHLEELPKALEYYLQAIQIFEEIGYKFGFATYLGNTGEVYRKLSDYTLAFEYLTRALNLFLEIGNKRNIVSVHLYLGLLYKQVSDSTKAVEHLNFAYEMSEEIGTKNSTMGILKAYSELYDSLGDIKSAFSYFKQYIAVKDEILSEESNKKAVQFEQRRKIEEDEKIRQLRLARFQEQEKILHNILPINIADRLLKQENFIADHFESVSVLFMDLVGFTKLSSIAPPKQLVFLLDAIFHAADEIVESYGLEKIKTIGDGYMAVANVTTAVQFHQKATALAALELITFLKDFSLNIPEELGKRDWQKDMNPLEVRVGIHTGEVVAGIIGKNKYTYDLWGDAVNVASRMESHSEAGKIHISDNFASSIQEYPEFSLIPRGEISVKGKGVMKTFWLEKAI